MEDRRKKHGYIVLSRKLQRDDLWLAEPFTKGQAWVDIIFLANFQDGTITIRGNVIQIKRGQLGWSEDKLALRWHWSRGRVNRFLRVLSMVQRIIHQKSRIISLITVINYDAYQIDSTTERASDSTTDDTTDDTHINKVINKAKQHTVTGVTDGSSIIIGLEKTMTEELSYERYDTPAKKSTLGKKTMAYLAYKYLELQDIRLAPGESYDANKIAKGLSKLYNETGKDVEKTVGRMTIAKTYFEDRKLDWTPEAVWRNWEKIKKWYEDTV